MYQCSHVEVSLHAATAGNAARTEAGHETLDCQQSPCNAPVTFLQKMRPAQHEGDCLQHLCFHLQSALQHSAWYARKKKYMSISNSLQLQQQAIKLVPMLVSAALHGSLHALPIVSPAACAHKLRIVPPPPPRARRGPCPQTTGLSKTQGQTLQTCTVNDTAF